MSDKTKSVVIMGVSGVGRQTLTQTVLEMLKMKEVPVVECDNITCTDSESQVIRTDDMIVYVGEPAQREYVKTGLDGILTNIDSKKFISDVPRNREERRAKPNGWYDKEQRKRKY